MGDLVALSQRSRVTTRKDLLIAMAMRAVPEDDPSRIEYEAAVRELILRPINSEFGLTTDELDHVEFFLKLITEHNVLKRDEAFIVSIMRMQKVTKWALLEDPRIVRFAKLGPARYLTYLQVMGTLALAWQVHTHPRDIILSEEVYRRAC